MVMAAACLLINCERANVGALCLTRDPPAMIYLAQFMSVTGFFFFLFYFSFFFAVISVSLPSTSRVPLCPRRHRCCFYAPTIPPCSITRSNLKASKITRFSLSLYLSLRNRWRSPADDSLLFRNKKVRWGGVGCNVTEHFPCQRLC